MKTFHVATTIKLIGTVSVEAENMEDAVQKADDTIFWAYQAGAPENHNSFSISDCEIEVDGEELDLFEDREAPEDGNK